MVSIVQRQCERKPFGLVAEGPSNRIRLWCQIWPVLSAVLQTISMPSTIQPPQREWHLRQWWPITEIWSHHQTTLIHWRMNTNWRLTHQARITSKLATMAELCRAVQTKPNHKLANSPAQRIPMPLQANNFNSNIRQQTQFQVSIAWRKHSFDSWPK